MAGRVVCGCGGGSGVAWRPCRRPGAAPVTFTGGVAGGRLAEHVVVLVGVLLLQLTCGHVVYNKPYAEDGADIRLTHDHLPDMRDDDDLKPYMVSPYTFNILHWWRNINIKTWASTNIVPWPSHPPRVAGINSEYRYNLEGTKNTEYTAVKH